MKTLEQWQKELPRLHEDWEAKRVDGTNLIFRDIPFRTHNYQLTYRFEIWESGSLSIEVVKSVSPSQMIDFLADDEGIDDGIAFHFGDTTVAADMADAVIKRLQSRSATLIVDERGGE